ncbi:hypothetical protein [Roseimicrobium sp. ORNL1]|uniref:hypothetical protein n=1 Tax=Roseimicrobium sp. ORNL1 TaxID=2711231 RepID=UPI0013E19309|nr:hypothetical protein [Roseimicrobium sp. ORNL1]QIF02924.1 hypothetical protein G5S37_15820 [Roseimicrobium sp. ORNL1]
MSAIIAVRRLIFLYFALLVFEGALRFWVLPSLSNLLLLVRDPVVILIYLLAGQAGIFPKNTAVGATIMLALVTGMYGAVAGDGPILVTVYGLRANFLHLPLIYVMQRALSAENVMKIGKWSMWLMIPMALLVVQQFRSPQGSWINMGGMNTQYGTVRPAGTFSFVSGMVCYSALVASFLANSFVSAKKGGWTLRILCSMAVLASLAVSGSRSSILSVGIVFVMLVGLSLVSGSAARGALALLGVIGLGAAGLSSTEFFEEGQRQLSQRFEDSSGGDSVVSSSLQRVAGMADYPMWAAQEAPIMGHGIGTGTLVGHFLTTGQRGFGGGQETELGRIFHEMGIVFGSIFFVLRLGICIQMLRQGWGALRYGNLLPMLLFGAGGMNVLMGSWGIATTQGFATFTAGLCLASVKVGRPKKKKAVRRAEPEQARNDEPQLPDSGEPKGVQG